MLDNEKTLIKLNDDVLALLHKIGFTPVFTHASIDYLRLGTRDKMIDVISIRWVHGLAHVLEQTEVLSAQLNTKPLDNYPFIAEVIGVPGLVSFIVVPYLIELAKAEVFTWDEIVVNFVEAWQTYLLQKEFKTHEQSR